MTGWGKDGDEILTLYRFEMGVKQSFLVVRGIQSLGDEAAKEDATYRNKQGITSLDRYDIMNSPYV